MSNDLEGSRLASREANSARKYRDIDKSDGANRLAPENCQKLSWQTVPTSKLSSTDMSNNLESSRLASRKAVCTGRHQDIEKSDGAN